MSTIVLLGATGYTGRRTARALVARGASPVLAGRDQGRLSQLADELGGLPTAVADVADPASVRGLVGKGDVLVTTVGPFGELGRPAVTAAVDAGATYIDSTGESPFIRRVFAEHGPRARVTGAALLTAFGHDWVLGNAAGALALERARNARRPATSVHVAYYLDGAGRGSMSRGTARSAFAMGSEPSYRFTGGAVVPERGAARLRRFDVDGELRPAFSTGGTEQLALPRSYPSLTDVEVYLGWLGEASTAVQRLSPVTDALGRVPGVSSALRRLGSAVADRLPEGPSAEDVADVRTQVVAEAYDDYGTRVGRVRMEGPEPYTLTADVLAWAAVQASEGAVEGTGALGPVEAFGLDPLLAALAEAGMETVD
jgi:short subunit dehydrogenase-like uncharacterized protein